MRPSRVPLSTYRVQLRPELPFAAVRELVPYLDTLGVTDLYCSPIAAARSGSSHGYDVVDPQTVNPELGGRDGLEALAAALAGRGMGLLLDVVPNHLAADPANPWWRDVLQRGAGSRYARWFDIEWSPIATKGGLEVRVLLPILGDLYGRVLTRGELRPIIDEAGPAVAYFERRLPLALRSWAGLLAPALASPPAEDDAGLAALRELAAEAARSAGDDGGERPAELDRRLGELWARHAGVQARLDAVLAGLAGTPGEPRSFDALDALLAEQFYRPAHWRLAAEEANYRRFFDLADLVSLRVEEPRVFEERHRLERELVAAGLVHGLRIDHVDGLYDPTRYLERLAEQVVPPGEAGRLYVVVEKILAPEEELPDEWPVAGTTGYDFLNRVSLLLVRPSGLAALERVDRDSTGRRASFAELRRAAKKQVLAQLFGGEVRRLAAWLGRLAAEHREARDLLPSERQAALVEVTADLPVYATYVRTTSLSARDRRWLEEALGAAAARTKDDGGRVALGFLRQVLLLEPPDYLAGEATLDEWRRFVMRWQALTGPVAAKGVEDTALYRHQRLVSLNEVGGEPPPCDDARGCGAPVGDLAAFHAWVAARAARWPFTLNASSTHDTKRSEDVRARLHVLSELPEEWGERLRRWSGWNRTHRRRVGKREAPSPGEEALLYQTLAGAWPLDQAEVPAFGERLAEFLVKAAREAKERTSWLAPDEHYEAALAGFAAALLDDRQSPFWDDFHAFQDRIAFYGAINGLTQLLLKLAAPGVPDVYQGSELWDLSLVDPDNRREVDWELRRRHLEELAVEAEADRRCLLARLLSGWRDGKAKLYLTWQGLRLRREQPELFRDGEYLPLDVGGGKAEHVIAFARRRGDAWCVAIAPRWPVALVEPEQWPLGEGIWADTTVTLPPGAPARWQSALTGEAVVTSGGQLAVAEALGSFPVALLPAARRYEGSVPSVVSCVPAIRAR